MACELIQREFKNSAGEPVLVGVRQLPASKALELQVELVGKMGNHVFPFIDNSYNFADIIQFMAYNKHEVVVELMKRVICMAYYEGEEIRPALYDMKYNGELMLACSVFAFVCEANFNDFFKQGLELNARRRSEAEEASKLAEQKNSSPEKI